MGDARDQLLAKAEHLAHDAVATAQQKVTEAMGAGTQGDPKAGSHSSAGA